MSRSRDIAKILGATEANNTSNVRLFQSDEEVGLDSGQVQNVGLQKFTALDSLPTTNLTSGQQAWIESSGRLYISNGSGWYNLALTNATPYWDSEPLTTYNIADSATPLIIVAKAKDSDNSDNNLFHQSTVTDSAAFLVDITRDSSVFTFTPKSQDSIGASVTAGDLTDSDTNDFIYTFKWSDGINFVSKAVTINYNFNTSETIQDLINRSASAGIYTVTYGDDARQIYYDGTEYGLYMSFGTGGSLSPASTYPAWKQALAKNSYIQPANDFTRTNINSWADGTSVNQASDWSIYTAKAGYFAFYNSGAASGYFDYSPHDTETKLIDNVLDDYITKIKTVYGPGDTAETGSNTYLEIQGGRGTPASTNVSSETTSIHTYDKDYAGLNPFLRVYEGNASIVGIHAVWIS